MFELSQDLLITADREGRFVFVSSAARLVLGRDPSEMIGSPYLSFVHPDDRATAKTSADDAFRGVPVTAVDIRFLRADGGTAWLNWNLQALPGPTGVLFGVGRDVSKQRESERRVQAVMDSVVDGLIVINEHGIVQSINPAAERIIGYSPAEVIGRNVKMLMPEPYHSEHDGYIANYLRTGDAKIIGIGREVVGHRKDGTTFPMDLAVSETGPSEGRQYIGIVRDITKRKRAEEQIAVLARFPDETPNPVMRIGGDGVLQYTNVPSAPLLKHFGCAVGHVVPEFCREVIGEALTSRTAKEV